jgi:hypothetical protein
MLAEISAKGGAPARRVKVGSVIVREHQGTVHEVMVVPDGFMWRGETYPSLSAIARKITGVSWSGPRFFGLAGADAAPAAVADDNARAKGQSDVASRGLSKRRAAASAGLQRAAQPQGGAP